MSFNGPRKPIMRRKRLAAGQPLKPRGATKDKKVKRYKAYLRSAAWKAKRAACIAAAGGRCEATFRVAHPLGFDGVVLYGEMRCHATDALTAHHLTYARFGNELPEDLQCLCRSCHDRVSALEGRRVS